MVEIALSGSIRSVRKTPRSWLAASRYVFSRQFPLGESQVTVVGAGLAGSEAACQLARRGIAVRLVEMRPVKMTEAHRTAHFAALVWSHSLRHAFMGTAVGV